MTSEIVSGVLGANITPVDRRNFLNQLARLPLIGGCLSLIGQPQAEAAPPLNPDPSFAAIEIHRVAEAQFVKRCGITEKHEREAAGLTEDQAQEIYDLIYDETEGARAELLATVPQTKAGLRAVLEYLADYYDKYGCMLDPSADVIPLLQSILASPVLAGGTNVG